MRAKNNLPLLLWTLLIRDYLVLPEPRYVRLIPGAQSLQYHPCIPHTQQPLHGQLRL